MKKFCYFMFALCLMFSANMVNASTINSINSNYIYSNYVIYNNNVIKSGINNYSKYSNMLRMPGERGDICKAISKGYGKEMSTIFCEIPRLLLFIFPVGIIIYYTITPMYGAKKIKMKNVNYYKDIPCNNELCLVYFLLSAYKIIPQNANLLNALLVKWLIEGKITITTTNKKTIINLFKDVIINNEYENKLYTMLIEASLFDYSIDIYKFKKWSYENCQEYYNWYESVFYGCRDFLVEKKLMKKTSDEEFEFGNIVNYEVSKIVGLKKYLINISKDDDVSFIDNNLLLTYLIYAELFGITDIFYKELKKSNTLGDVLFKNYNNIKYINKVCDVVYENATHSLRRKENKYEEKERRNIRGRHHNSLR